MTATYFIDTNVLLYAASNAPEDEAKQALARRLLKRAGIAFSAQVAQEFYAAAVSKQRLRLTHDEAKAVVVSLVDFPICPTNHELVAAAIDARQRHQISYWDAAILVAAKLLGCRIVCSEDLNDGQDYDGVRVVNPFRATPTDPPAEN
ncbi:MAG: PIN domain-containing protein [Pirellulaceae bacterium]|nr:PIN domain-containing protein [Pirellulaceae bacterium]